NDGDIFPEFTVYGGKGKGGSPIGMYLDNMAITKGQPVYMFPKAGKGKLGFVRKVTLDRNKDFVRMELAILANLTNKIGKDADKKKVLAAGGLHITSNFLKDFAKDFPDVTLVRAKKAGSKVLISELPPLLEESVKQEKPAVTVILIGTQDIIKQMDNAEAPAHFMKMIKICVDNGSIPVMMNVPYVWSDEVKDKVNTLNSRVTEVLKSANIPFINIYDLLTKTGKKPKSNFSGAFKISSKGHRELSGAFSKLYKILSENAF
ncbi:SGNH/GDSL hydrolase family protein, partial [Planctomycetota bacterium]